MSARGLKACTVTTGISMLSIGSCTLPVTTVGSSELCWKFTDVTLVNESMFTVSAFCGSEVYSFGPQ